MPKLSVIVPVYNVEGYLDACLESLQAQSMRDFDIICVNDGSTDASLDKLTTWADQDRRIRVIDKPNGGLYSARNAGIEAASTEYGCFFDSDDRFHPDACATIVDLLDETGADVLTFGATCYPPEAEYPWLTDVLSPRDCVYTSFSMDVLFKERSRPFAWRTACRRDFLEDNGIRFDERLRFGEDQVFDFQIYPRSSKTVFSSKKLYEYRVAREGSLMDRMNLDPEAKLLEHVKLVDTILSDWRVGGFISTYAGGLAEWVVEFVLFDAMKLPYASYRNVSEHLRAILSQYWDRHEMSNLELPLAVRDSLLYACYRLCRVGLLRRRLAYNYCAWRYGAEAAHREFS